MPNASVPASDRVVVSPWRWTRPTSEQLRCAQRTGQALHYLTGELHAGRRWSCCVRVACWMRPRGRANLTRCWRCWARWATGAVPAQREHLRSLHRTLTRALPAAVTFVAGVERVEQELRGILGEGGLALIAWAWQRRGILGPSAEELVAGLPEAWRQAARVLMATWDGAARASSAVEGWHSIVRPHLAVHRRLSAGLLALLAVWHNHRVFTRGTHQGASPFS